MDIKNKKISILGAVRSGIAAAKLAKKMGALPFVSDFSPEHLLTEQISLFKSLGIEYECGGHTERVFDCDFIVTSPGVPSDAQVIIKAKEKNIQIISEIEFGYWFCKGKIIGITGTNGKTTTTNLVAHILNNAGLKTHLAGNIGFAFSEIAAEVAEDEFIALEISSFQLDYVKFFKPYIAIILNITPDHLDRYQNNFDQYANSKFKITKNQTSNEFLILNADNKYLAEKDFDTSAVIKLFSTRMGVDEGAFISEGKINVSNEDSISEICSLDKLSLKGEHNQSNSLSAIMAAKICGVENSIIETAIATFPGVEHRLEFVRTINGVDYINDSKATNVDSVWYALQSFKGKINLILGGKDKGNDYSQIIELVKKNVKKIYAIGSSAETVDRYFNVFVKVEIVKSMEEAVSKSKDEAEQGEVVLLSPACASFDMYKNFEERGKDFKNIVLGLTE